MATIVSVHNQVYFGCIFCNQVFTNFQLFKTHFDSHFAQENIAMRNLNHINSQRAPLQPNFPRSIFMQGTNGNNVTNNGLQGSNLNNIGSRVPQQLGIGGALLQPNFPRSVFVQGTNGINVGNRVFQGTNLNNVGSRVPQQLGIGGAVLQPNFPRSMFVQGTNGINVGNRVFQGTNINNVGNIVTQQLAIGGESLQPNFPRSMFMQGADENNVGNIVFQGTNISNVGSSNVGSRVSQQLAIGGASSQPNFPRSMVVQETGGNIVVNIVFQRTNINNAGNRVLLVPPQNGIGATSLQPNFPRSMFMEGTEINNVGNKVVQVLPQQAGLMSQTRTNQILNTNHPNVASQPLITSFVAPHISQGNDAMEVSSIDRARDYINQLDQPIDNNEFVDFANVNDETLNLELGL